MATILVTQEDIDYGIPCTCRLCPIALAIQRQFPTISYIGVGSASVRFEKDRETIEYCFFPWEAVQFIRLFDDSKHVEPFSFELRISDVLATFRNPDAKAVNEVSQAKKD